MFTTKEPVMLSRYNSIKGANLCTASTTVQVLKSEMMKILLLEVIILLTIGLQCLSYKYTDYTDLIQFSSCQDILTKFPDTPSGYYSLKNSKRKVYCDMERVHCGSKGWTRVAHVDMSSDKKSCPGNWTLINNPIRTCGSIPEAGCASAVFSTHGISYSQVCGRVRGYQKGIPEAFGPFTNDQSLVHAGVVLDGVLISHGDKTKSHIWAYVTGQQRIVTYADSRYCPCASNMFNGIIPTFLRNDYYCDSGSDNRPLENVSYTDPLWEGKNCPPTNFCCSDSGMPWFCKTLPEPTADDIEVRNCHNSPSSNEDTLISLIELYVR